MKQSPNNVPHNLDQKAQLDQMLSGGGELGALIRELDWSNTPLGSIETWSQSLRTALSICLFSRFPIHIWWGPEFVELYNDAYRPILGSTKHPASLGQPGAATSAEIWHIIGPMLQNVYDNAVSTWSDNLMLPMDRYGFTEETYFTLSYSPIFVEAGKVGGVFTVVTETTRQVLGERRLRTLHRLSERTSDAKTASDACLRAAETLAENPQDIPFALIYMLNEDGTQAELVCSSSIQTISDLNPLTIDLVDDADSPWRLGEVLASKQLIQVHHLSEHFTTQPPSPWEEHPHTALVLPILSSGGGKVAGFLIGGISARLSLDEEYQHFYELVAGHVATAVSNAHVYEEERRRAEALAELDRAKTDFFSNVSHEFRTPLTLILSPLQEVLKDGNNLSDEQRIHIETAYRNSLRLQKLVNTLLDFSRIQSNRIQASFQPTDLATLTADLASNFRSVVERAGLRLIIDCPPLPEPVYVDQDMWEKIVLNLLSNAFKFTFEGEISVSLRATADSAVLQVQDTGVGIDKVDMPHIFERFHRVVGVRSRTYEGSGIGLALVAELVRFHGGQIEASSTPDVGTTFTISLPLGSAHLPEDQISATHSLASTAIDAASYTEEALRWLTENEQSDYQPPPTLFETAEITPLTSYQLSNRRILVADDNADMRDYLTRLLEPRYQVETANDGAAALKIVEAQPPDLVIADVMMPNMDGFALLQMIRTDTRTRSIPVMLLSARAGEEARIEGLQAGANDYLTKPFSARELLARVEAQLQLAQIRQEAQTTVENVIEGIADPFYAVDRNWRFIYVNHHAQEMWGKTSADLIGRSIWEIFPQGVATESYQYMNRAVETQQATAFETFSILRNQWFEVNLYPNSSGLAVYFRNIDSRKQFESALRETEERLQFAQQAGNVGVWDWDAATQKTYWGDVMWKLYGLEPQPTAQKDDIWNTMLHPDDRERVEEKIALTLASTEIDYRDEFRIVRADGAIRWIESTGQVARDADNKPIRMSGVNLDITERKRIEGALREAEERFRLIVDSAKDYAIFALDLAGQVVAWNTGAEQVFGFTESEIIGVTGSIIYTPEDRAEGIPEREMRKAIELGYAENERWHVRKDGSRLYASGMMRPIYDEIDTLRGFTKVARDMTERKLAEERADILQYLTAELSTQLYAEEMATSILRAIRRTVGEAMVSVFLYVPEEEILKRLVTEGFSAEAQKQFYHLPLASSLPLSDAIRAKEIIWLTSQEDYISHYPHLEKAIIDNNIHSAIAIPLILDEQFIGGITISFSQTHQLSKPVRDLLVVIAHLCAQSLQRANLYQQAKDVAALEERSRLAHELHDAVSQTLFSATIIAQSLPNIWSTKPDKAFVLLGDTVKLIRAAMAEMRTLLLELRPEGIVRVPLSQLIEQLITALQGRKKVTVDYKVEGEIPQLDDIAHVELYRIVQESFNNIAKHSRATEITVRLEQHGTGINLQIIDNGQGFDASVISGGFGLTSMRERAAKIGAELSIISAPQDGTRISLSWNGDKKQAKGKSG